MLEFLTSKKVRKLTDKIGQPFESLPHLPKSFIEFIAKIAPWLVALGGIFSLFGSLSSLRWALGRSPMRRWANELTGLNSSYYTIMAILQLIMAWLALNAFKPLKKRKMEGWLYIFWSNVISMMQALVGFLYVGGSPVLIIISIALGLYVLYELRSEYNGQKKAAKSDTKVKE